MITPLLSLRQIAKSYEKGKMILRPFDLDINENEIFFLLGPSGCGKSTLLRIIAGLLNEDSGDCILKGKKINNLAPEKRRMSMVFQNYALWPHLNVYENIAFGMKMAKIPKKEIENEVSQLLKLVQLEGFEKRLTTELSGGQQQRVALARALAVKPDLLLLDEPLSNLDSKLRDTMRLEIRRILKARQVSAIYVTHDRTEALSIADRIGIMQDGRIVQCGTPQELYYRPLSAFTAEFLGAINFFDARIIKKENDHYVVQNENFIWQAAVNSDLNFEENEEVTIGVREEHISFDPGENTNTISAVLAEKTFMGDHTEYLFKANGLKIGVRSAENFAGELNSTAILNIDKSNTMVLKKK